jgi:hypothetical protein
VTTNRPRRWRPPDYGDGPTLVEVRCGARRGRCRRLVASVVTQEGGLVLVVPDRPDVGVFDEQRSLPPSDTALPNPGRHQLPRPDGPLEAHGWTSDVVWRTWCPQSRRMYDLSARDLLEQAQTALIEERVVTWFPEPSRWRPDWLIDNPLRPSRRW